MQGIPCVHVSNVLSEEKRQQVIALGRVGWSLRRIEAAVHIRRETVGGYLRSAGIPVRPPGGWGRRAPANPANEVITDFGAESATITAPEPQPGRSPSASACEPYRELIEMGLSRGRNANAIWQDLVDSYSFTPSYQSVQRFNREAAQIGGAGSTGGDRDPSRRRSASRLRLRAYGAPSADWQVSPHAARSC